MSLIETTKTVYDLAKKAASVELQQHVMQLREEALELQEENLKLRKENLMLKEKIESQETIKFVRQVYFRDGDNIPFCPYCYDRHQLLIHLSGPEIIKDDGHVRGQVYTCQECATEYFTKEEGDYSIWSGRHRK